MSRDKDETLEERAERRFHEQAKIMHGDRLVIHYLEGIRRAIHAFSKNVGKGQSIQNKTLSDGLAAIALAASTPSDNSAEIQTRIDQMVVELNTSTAEVKDAIDQQQKGE